MTERLEIFASPLCVCFSLFSCISALGSAARCLVRSGRPSISPNTWQPVILESLFECRRSLQSGGSRSVEHHWQLVGYFSLQVSHFLLSPQRSALRSCRMSCKKENKWNADLQIKNKKLRWVFLLVPVKKLFINWRKNIREKQRRQPGVLPALSPLSSIIFSAGSWRLKGLSNRKLKHLSLACTKTWLMSGNISGAVQASVSDQFLSFRLI